MENRYFSVPGDYLSSVGDSSTMFGFTYFIRK